MRACPSLAYRPTCACACASSPGKKLVPRVSHVFCGRRVVYGCKMGDRRRSSRTNSIFILEHAGVGGGITGAWYTHAQGRHDRRNGFPLALLGSRLNSTYVGLSADRPVRTFKNRPGSLHGGAGFRLIIAALVLPRLWLWRL
jgi:hypothetical protein